MEKKDVLNAVYPKIEATHLLKGPWNKIQGLPYRDTTDVMFLIFLYLNEKTVEICQAFGDETKKKAELMKLADEMNKTFTREIVHESLAGLNSSGISNFLKMGFESLMNMLPQIGTQEMDEFVDEVFNHDKGYPRSVNYVQSYTPFTKRTIESVINDLLDGFANTSIFTGGKDTRSYREQLKDWPGKDKKAKYEAWGRIVAHIIKRLHLGWEKAPIKKLIEQSEMKFVNTLRDVIPVTELKVFMAKDFKIVAQNLYLED